MDYTGVPVPNVPLGAACVLVDDSGRILLVHHTYGERNWEIPGGVLEAHESAATAAAREMLEETGSLVEIERLTGVYWEAEWGPVGGHHFVFRVQLARNSPAPTVTDRAEIGEIGWFGRDELPRPISDFTIQRIDDALTDRPATVTQVPPRTWLR